MKHVLRKVKQVCHAVIDFGRRAAWDLVALAGVAVLAGGLWWIYPPAALVGIGGALVGLACWGARQWPR